MQAGQTKHYSDYIMHSYGLYIVVSCLLDHVLKCTTFNRVRLLVSTSNTIQQAV